MGIFDGRQRGVRFTSGDSAEATEGVQPQQAVYLAHAMLRGHPNRKFFYSLGSGGDNDFFHIDSNTGYVYFNSPPDYEAARGSTYNITINAFRGNKMISKVVTIQVTDLNDNAPIFNSATTASTPENVAATTPVYVAHATDADGTAPNNTVRYALLPDNYGDNRFFNINATTGEVTFKAPPDYENPQDQGRTNHYTVALAASDGKYTTYQNVVITVTDVNENAPVFTSGATATEAENTPATSIVYTARATDADAAPGNTITYSLAANVGDNNQFTIDAATGAVRFKAAPNFEAPTDAGTNNVYDIVVTATDAGNPALSTNKSVAITVTDQNDNAPVFTSGAAVTVPEGTGATTVVYTAQATDADGTSPNNKVTYALGGTDAAKFSIDAATGEVRFLTSPNYETPADSGGNNVYDITVIATDGGNPPQSSGPKPVQITVSDVAPSQPTDGDTATANAVTEGAATGTYTGLTAASTDVNGGTVTYSLTDDAGGRFAIDGSTGRVTVTAAGATTIDYESSGGSYNVTVKAADASGASTTRTFAIAVNDVAPTTPADGDAATANRVAEGAAAGTYTGLTAASSDINGGTVTYTLTDDAGGRFTIGSDGRVLVSAAGASTIDYETSGGSYNVTVKAADASGAFTTQTFAIAVTDVAPSTPTDGDAATANSVVEGASAGTYTGLKASSSDVNGGTVTYSLTDDAGGRFAIGSDGRVLVTAVGAGSIDYETAPGNAYSVTVKAADASGAVTTQTFTIAVNNAPPSTPVDANGADNQVSSGAAQGSSTGLTASSMDPGGTAVTYTLTNSDGGHFQIDPSTGVVTVGATAPTYNSMDASQNTRTITVQATDTAGASTTADFTITINPNAPPVNTVPAGTQTVAEDSGALPISGVSVSDSDDTNLTTTVSVQHGTVSVTANGASVTNNGSGTVTISGSTTQVNAALATLAYTNTADYYGSDTLTVSTTDGKATTNSTVAINVTAVGDASPDNATTNEDTLVNINVNQNDSFENAGHKITAIDGQAITVGGTVAVLDGTVVLKGDGTLDFTPSANYNGSTGFTYTVTSGGATETENVSVTVNPVNDAPSFTLASTTTTSNEDAGAQTVTGFASNISFGPANEFGQSVSFVVDSNTNPNLFAAGAGPAIDASGNLTYTAAANANGTATITVHAMDTGGTANGGVNVSAGQNFTITVNSVNDAPSGTDKAISGAGPHTFTVADFGFTDPNDNPANTLLAVEITTLPASGTLTNNGQPVTAGQFIPVGDISGGQLVFTPSGGPESASFTFQVQDNGGTMNGGVDLDQSPNTITLTPNSPPMITSGGGGDTATVAAPENQTAVTTVVASDPDMGPNAISYSITGGADAAKFNLDATTGALTFKAAPNFEAPGSAAGTNTYTVVVAASDGAASDTQTITVNVTNVNEAPTANPDAVSAIEAGGVNNGTAGVNPGIGANPGFNVLTGTGETIGTGADTDPDSGDTLTVAGVAAGTTGATLTTGANADVTGTYGTIHVNSDGSATYTVNNSNTAVQALRTTTQTLTDTYSYTVKDAGGLTSTTQVTVTIHGQNDNPVAVADTASATEAGGVNNGTAGTNPTGNVLTNETDPDAPGGFATAPANGETHSVSAVSFGPNPSSSNVGQSINGTYGALVLNANGSYTYTVDNTKPAVERLGQGESATDTFSYTVKDTAGATSDTTLTVTINGANDAPVANAFTSSGNEDVNRPITLSGSDIDNGDSIASYKITALPSATVGTLYSDAGYSQAVAVGGTVGSTVYFKPAANYSGTGSFQYAATDNHGLTGNSATVTIDVSPVADGATVAAYNVTPTTSTTQAEAPVASDLSGTSIVSAISGGYAIAWANYHGDDTADIVVQRYDYTGAAQGSQIIVKANTGTPLADLDPDITKLPNGGFLVTFDRSFDGNDQYRDVLGHIYAANGNPVGTEFTIATHPNGTTELIRPSSAAFSDGHFVTAYQQTNANEQAFASSVYVQLVNANGTTTGQPGPILVTSTPGHAQISPQVAALSAGDFIVTWSEGTVGSGGTISDYDVHAQRFTAAGARVGGELTVNTQTANNQTGQVVAGLAGGGWVIAFGAQNAAGNNIDINARVYSAAGVPGAVFTVNTLTAGSQETPSITALPDGGFIVSYVNEAGADSHLYAQRFDATGAQVGNEYLTAGGSGSQTQSSGAIAALGNGDVALTWQDSGGTTRHSIAYNIPGDGVQGVATPLTTLNATLSDTDGSESYAYHLTGYTAGTTFNYGAAVSSTEWLISSQADINALKTDMLTATVPTAGYFTLTIETRDTDTATLSTGPTSSTSSVYKTIPVGIRTGADPVFAAHDSGPFDLHLSPVAATDTVHIDVLPDAGTISTADGTVVKAGAVISAADLAGLKFTPLDDGADHASNFIYTVSNGSSVDTQTLPVYVQHGSNLTLTGTADKDVIVGGAGNDVLKGAGGGNFLTGGGGADLFVFDAKSLADATGPAKMVDHVTDYSAAQGDSFDFTALYASTSNPSAHAAELVHATMDAGGHSATLSVNIAAAGEAPHWAEIAHLDGVEAGATIDVALDAAHPHQLSHIHVDAVA